MLLRLLTNREINGLDVAVSWRRRARFTSLFSCTSVWLFACFLWSEHEKKKVASKCFTETRWPCISFYLAQACKHKNDVCADVQTPNLPPPPPQLCPGEVKPKPERRELSQLLNLSTHPQQYPLKINDAGKPPSSSSCLIREHTHAPALCWKLFGDFPAAVPGSRCENGGSQACRFIRQCGDHYTNSGNVETGWEVAHPLQLPGVS